MCVVAVAVLPRTWAFVLLLVGGMVVPAVIAHFATRGGRRP